MKNTQVVNGLSVTSLHLDQPDPLVVLVHGALDRGSSFARAARHLNQLPIIRYDRRGYGRSHTTDPLGLNGHVADLFGLIGTRRAVVVGHSFGGVVGLRAASERPDQVIAVGAFESPMMWRPWWPRTTPGGSAVKKVREGGDGEAAGETFMVLLIGEQRWQELPDRVKAARRAEGATLVAELTSIRSANPPYDPKYLEFPILAGYGTLSKPHMIKAAQTLAEEAPHGECMVFESAGHGAHLSHPKQFADFVLRVRDLGLEAVGGGSAREGG